MTQHPGWFLIVAGLVIAAIGVVWLIGPSISRLGKLPGDSSIERGNFNRFTLDSTREAATEGLPR